MHLRRVLSVLLPLALGCALLAPAAQARETSFFSSFPDPVPLEEQTWAPADTAEFDNLLSRLQQAICREGNQEEVLALSMELLDTYQAMRQAYTFCMLDYYRDPETYVDEFSAWGSAVNHAGSGLLAGLQAAMTGGYGPALTTMLGMDYAVSLLNAQPDTPEQLALLAEESSLVSEYWAAVTADYQVEVNGTLWSMADLQTGGTLSGEEQKEIMLALSQARNAAAVPILLRLVALRNEYAASKGYDSYADYAYETLYGRDYTPEVAAALHADVKEQVVPLARALTLVQERDPDLDLGALAGLSGLTQEEMLDAVEPYIAEISDEYAAVYDYMRTYGLCDIGPLDTKLSVGFTTDLPMYGSAYLFNAPLGDYSDVEVLIHEFGHYANFCLTASPSACYDVSEIHSQGLEALCLTFADELAGEEGGDAYRAAVVLSLVLTVADGCLYDEFQQRLYAEGGDMTVSDVNRLFRALAEEYGYNYAVEGDEAYDWVLVSHTFEQPFYYLSYATSALSALELLGRSAGDFNGAADTYLALTAQNGVPGYRGAVEMAGLSDVFEEGAVADITAGLWSYACSEIYDLPAFSDLEGHWAAESAQLCAACGLFAGDGAGNFVPDSTLTRAQLVTVLWRLAGSPEEESGTAYGDVLPGSWYEEAVRWASGAGVAAGVGSGEGALFAPDAAMTREQFAAMLYRFCGSPETEGESDGQTAYGDWAAVSGWADDAVAWAVEEGILTGKPGGLLDPGGTVTRGEAAVMLQRSMET